MPRATTGMRSIAGVPLSGQPNRFAYPDARFGFSYDVFGKGNTMVRGGWGVYRFVTQVNTVDSPLFTAQDVLGYNLPGGYRVQLQNIHNLQYTPCPSATNRLAASAEGNGAWTRLTTANH